MKKSLVMIATPTIILVIIAFLLGGSDLVKEGLQVSMNTIINSALMLIASFVVIGQLQVLITKEVLDQWLQRFNGLKGIIIGSIAGGLFPGGPYVYYPFIQSFSSKGIPFYMLIAFILGKGVYDFARIPMEVSLISAEVTLIRNLITLPIPILMALLAKRLFKNRTIEDIYKKEGKDNEPSNPYS